MTFGTRLAVIALAAFTAAGLAGVLVVPWLSRSRRAGTSAMQATTLFALRMIPAASAFAAAALLTLSYLFFEPRDNVVESAGTTMIVLAALGAMQLGFAAGRGVWLLREGRRAARQWFATASPIALPSVVVPAFVVDTPFPIVAVFGAYRPRMVIARRVLEACPPEELAAVLAHEQSHVRRRDNLRRVMIALTPDLLGWLRFGPRLADAWHDASEEAADDAAAALGPAGRVTLAAALIRVARLAPAGHALQYLPTSALYRGENLDRRVRRLLDPLPAPPAPVPMVRRAQAAAVALVAFGLVFGGIQELIELAMTQLP